MWSIESHSQTESSTPDAALAELAARQHGVVTVAQLRESGFGAGAIKYRRRVGRLHLLHPGVYAVGHRPPSPLATAMAAVLAFGVLFGELVAFSRFGNERRSTSGLVVFVATVLCIFSIVAN